MANYDYITTIIPDCGLYCNFINEKLHCDILRITSKL